MTNLTKLRKYAPEKKEKEYEWFCEEGEKCLYDVPDGDETCWKQVRKIPKEDCPSYVRLNNGDYTERNDGIENTLQSLSNKVTLNEDLLTRDEIAKAMKKVRDTTTFEGVTSEKEWDLILADAIINAGEEKRGRE